MGGGGIGKRGLLKGGGEGVSVEGGEVEGK